MIIIDKKKLLLLSSFSLGMNQPIIFVFLTSLWCLFLISDSAILNKRMCFASLVLMVYVLLFYSRPEYITNADYKYKIFVFFIFYVIYLFQIYSLFGRVAEPSIVKCLMWSIYIKLFCICVYSLYLGDYGYGLIYDPFAREEVNSPAYSNQLSICLVYFLLMTFSTTTRHRWIYLLFLSVGIYFGFFLGGRFLFVALLFSMVLLFFKLRLRTAIIVFMCMLLISISIYFLSENNYYISFMLERFSSGGSNSLRFLHIIDGIEQLILNPLGGFFVNPAIEDTHWFHNLVLDSAKVFGYVILMPLFIMIFVFGLSSIKGYYDKNFFYLSIMSIVLLVVMMQDVVMEYNIILLMLYFLFSCDLFLKRPNTRGK